MIQRSQKPRIYEEHRIPTKDGNYLYAKLMFPKPPMNAKRLLFLPPLVGASASQSLIIFRSLCRRGAILLSYEYEGHPRSTGTFELDDTVVDTHHAIRWADRFACEHGLPMHGVAMCYGLVSILAAQFKKDQTNKVVSNRTGSTSPFWSITAMSGLFNLEQIIDFRGFIKLYGQNLGRELDQESFLRGIKEGIFDWKSDTFRNSLQEFFQNLFPEISISNDHFAELVYDRVNFSNLLRQFVEANYLKDIYVPPEIPCSFLFGRHDTLLGINHSERREEYFDMMRAIVPHGIVTFIADADHNGCGPDRTRILEHMGDMCEEAEAKAVPLAIQNQETDTESLANKDTQHQINQ